MWAFATSQPLRQWPHSGSLKKVWGLTHHGCKNCKGNWFSMGCKKRKRTCETLIT